MHWFTRSWWRYLFAPVPRNRYGFFGRLRDRWTSFICRARGHPYGVVWYNPSGFEPDMTCKNCGDDLG